MKNRRYSNIKSLLNGLDLFFLVVLSFSLSACLKEDNRLKKPAINSVITTINNIKKNQVYYNLKDSSIVAINDITDWDLRFDCDEHFNIWLNSARIMYVADAGIKNMNDFNDNSGLTFSFDFSTGARDSNAIRRWGDFSMTNPSSFRHTYVLFKGQNENGDSLGFIKMQIKDFSANSYTIEFKDLADITSTPHTLIVPKNSEYNYTYVSLKDNGSVVNIEPKKTEWDLWFTLYTTYVYNFSDGLFYPYQVGGCLINPYMTEVAFDTLDQFQNIDILQAQNMTYYPNWDIIGYGWKSFSGIGSGSGEYTIYTNITYTLKNYRNEYYKIRFMDYYNTSRQSGYPKFEHQQL
jgi:hypothetical protein